MYIENSLDNLNSKQVKLILILLFFLSFFYSLLNRNWYAFSSIIQVLMFVVLTFLFCMKCTSVKKGALFFFIIICFPFLVFSQQQYLLNPIAFFFIYELTRKISAVNFINICRIYALVFSVLSILLFKLLKGGGLYNYLEFSNQILPGFLRLLGPDGSPVSLSLVAIVGVISCSYSKRSLVNFTLLIFFVFIIFWSGSRTTLLALVLSVFLGKFRGSLFSMLVFSITLAPFLLIYLYMNYQDNLVILAAIEGVTSYRIVNWVNAVYYYLESDIDNLLFGLGHLPKLEDAYLSKSLFDGHYSYKFVTYTESAILRILVNYGLIFYSIFFFLTLKLAMKMKRYIDRVCFLIIINISFLYDPVYSIQYFYILFFYFFLLNFSVKYINDSV